MGTAPVSRLIWPLDDGRFCVGNLLMLHPAICPSLLQTSPTSPRRSLSRYHHHPCNLTLSSMHVFHACHTH